MKKLFYWVLISLFLPSCMESDQEKRDDAYEFTIQTPGKEYSIHSMTELNSWLEMILQDGTTVDSSSIQYSQGGNMYYLYARGKNPNGYHMTMGMVVDKFATERSGETVIYQIGEASSSGPPSTTWKECFHTCASAPINTCTTCDLTIHTECKGISCTCKTEDGGCEGTIRIVYHD